MLDVLEVDEGRRQDVEQVVAQCAVPGLLVADLAGEAPHGVGAVAYGHRIDASKGSGEDEGQAAGAAGHLPRVRGRCP